MSRTSITSSPPPTGPSWWRTLAEQAATTGEPARPAERGDEFAAGASTWPDDMSRRHFLETMAAAFALAGLSGCGRPTREKIVPYVTAPEGVVPGRPQFFATAMPWQGYARGILVESHLGRPTKIEGNPDHPDSLGATDAVTQAAILGLYDPDRSRVPLRQQQPSSWAAFEEEWLTLRRELDPTNGAGLAFVTEPTTSPTTLRLIHRLLDRLPAARWYQHTALARFERDGHLRDFDPAAAEVIVSIDADFLFEHPASLRYTRAFAARRRVVANDRPPNRLYVIEPTPSITGTMADHRLPASPPRIAAVLNALAVALGAAPPANEGADALDAASRQFVDFAARDLRAHAPAVALVAGPHVDESIHPWVDAMNRRLGAVGPVVRHLAAVRSDADPRCAGQLPDLANALATGEVRALLVLGGNPAYTAPAELELAALIPRAPFSLHLGLHVDETARHCRWHLPESHFLETWADLRASDGTATILQPLIEPLYATHSLHGVLQFLSEPPGKTDYDAVRDTWREHMGPAGFESAWASGLQSGIAGDPEAAPAPERASPDAAEVIPVLAASDSGTVVLFRPDPWIADGRWAGNAWLQELPKPLSHLVWDNAAWISPALAREHRLEIGDILTLESNGRTLDVAVWIQPGQAERCITLHLGYGRERAGTVGTRLGFNAFRLRTSDAPWIAPVTALRRTGRRHHLVTTQEHFTMDRRDLVRVVSASEIARIAPAPSAHPALLPEWPSTGYAWAMSIDLSTCIGCSACVAACQAENNTPVVGKAQVARGREMHWLRIDRYYAGDPAAPTMAHQPIPCMHCEAAPCELVCPVAATVHSSEGLNDMVYNRCIGTRYCSNNCPYKVRRFNFLDYSVPADSPATLQLNPNVTVRTRGVMEKCTYCVQRINAARIEASKENRRIRDGEVRPACQQACPAGAIVFGDLLSPDSAVSTRRAHPLNYALLAELNTKPRTTYLTRVANPVGNDRATASS